MAFCAIWVIDGFRPAGAAITHTVTTTADRDNGSCVVGDCSLREAIKYAASGDVVTFGLSGIFTIGSLGEIEIDKNLTIDGLNTNVMDTQTMISGGAAYRLFKITSGNVHIKEVFLTQGYTETYSADDPGGACILNTGGALTLYTVRITNSQASYKSAGAIYSRGDLTMDNCYITGNSNQGSYSGGAVAAVGVSEDQATVNITDTYFGYNTCQGNGGALSLIQANAQIARCTFEQNNGQGSTTTGGGGAVLVNQATADISDTTFDSNQTLYNGGAVCVISTSTATVTGSTFTGNQCRYHGGGLYQYNGSLHITNCTFAGNQSWRHGGGIWAFTPAGSPTRIDFTTITDNTADSDCGAGGTCDDGNGGGLYLEGTYYALKGVLLAGNHDSTTSGTVQPDCGRTSGSFQTAGGNLVGVNTGCDSSFPTGSPNVNEDYAGTAVLPLAAGLDALADNGGLTQTCALSPGSLALNHGPTDSHDLLGALVTTDQRGLGRKRGSRVDIGAYEVAAGGGSLLGLLLE